MFTTVITIFLTSIIAGVGWLFKNENDKRREVEKQLSDKKYSVYTSIISLFFEIVNGARLKKEISIDEAANRMMIITENLIIYGSDNVLKKYSEWKRNSKEGDGMYAIIAFTEIILEIRRDMGQQNSTVNMDDILGTVITDYAVFKKQITEYKRNLPNR